MALINCSNCGKPVSDTAERCPHCGASVKEAQQKIFANMPKSSNGKGLAGLMFSIAGLAYVLLAGLIIGFIRRGTL